MFAALTVVRLREAVLASSKDLINTASWHSPDDVPANELPLAKATEKTLASMHAVLAKTAEARRQALEKEHIGHVSADSKGEIEEDPETQARLHRLQTRVSEVRVVRYVDDLKHPKTESEGIKFEAEIVDIQPEIASQEEK